MAKEIYTPELTAFLKRHRKYTAAKKHAEKASVDATGSSTMFIPEEGYDSLMSAFRWKNTPEGHNYWSELNKEFRDEQENS